MTTRIQPCLWFDDQAEETASHYTASSCSGTAIGPRSTA